MLEPGFYWTRIHWPMSDGQGYFIEKVGEPEVARWDGLRWYATGVDGELADQVTVDVICAVPAPESVERREET